MALGVAEFPHVLKVHFHQVASGLHFWCLFRVKSACNAFTEGNLCLFFPSQTHTHTGQTSRVRCSPPTKLLNGYHRPAPDTAGGAETIEFFCKKSYILSGNHQITCLSNGSWSSRPPTCVRGSCFFFFFFKKYIRVGNTLLDSQSNLFFYCVTMWGRHKMFPP